jgi:hypothetical protein
MTDRRRTPRYILKTPLAADAMPMQDVMLERRTSDRLTVIAPSSHAADEELMIHITTADGLVTHRTAVVSSNPVSIAGTLSFRLELRVLDAPEPPSDGRIH